MGGVKAEVSKLADLGIVDKLIQGDGRPLQPILNRLDDHIVQLSEQASQCLIQLLQQLAIINFFSEEVCEGWRCEPDGQVVHQLLTWGDIGLTCINGMSTAVVDEVNLGVVLADDVAGGSLHC